MRHCGDGVRWFHSSMSESDVLSQIDHRELAEYGTLVEARNIDSKEIGRELVFICQWAPDED